MISELNIIKWDITQTNSLLLFVKRGFVTPEEYFGLTGVEYDPEKAHA